MQTSFFFCKISIIWWKQSNVPFLNWPLERRRGRTLLREDERLSLFMFALVLVSVYSFVSFQKEYTKTTWLGLADTILMYILKHQGYFP